jgi:hypothetical protein
MGKNHKEVKHRIIGGGRVLSRIDSQANPWRSSHSDSKMGALGRRMVGKKKGTNFGGGGWMAIFFFLFVIAPFNLSSPTPASQSLPC